jgi:hypothetical protein
MEEKPFNRPGDNPLDDWLARRPIVVDGIVNAKRRKIRIVSMAINMLRRLTRSTRIGADWRVDHQHTDIRIAQVPAVEVTA